MPKGSMACRRPRRKALLIGVSGSDHLGYDSDDSPLESPPLESEVLNTHRDIELIRNVLIKNYGYLIEDIVVMEDHVVGDPALFPDKKHITRQMRQLVRGANSEDRFFFFFAGHGTQMHCDSDSESDGEDEYIQAADGKWIKDNALKHILVDHLPPGSQLVSLIDACHSGSMLDLPHKMLPTSRQRDIAIFVVNRTHHVITAFRLRIKLRKQVDPGFNQDVSPSSASSVSEPETPSDEFQMVHRKRSVRRGKKQQRPPLVVSLSASLDSQVSLETEEGGPLAQAFARSHDGGSQLTYRGLLHSLEKHFVDAHKNRMQQVTHAREWIQALAAKEADVDPELMRRIDEQSKDGDFIQQPQLRGSQPFDVDAPFVI